MDYHFKTVDLFDAAFACSLEDRRRWGSRNIGVNDSQTCSTVKGEITIRLRLKFDPEYGLPQEPLIEDDQTCGETASSADVEVIVSMGRCLCVAVNTQCMGCQ